MKIRTQFMISTVLLGSFLLLFSATEFITNLWVQKINHQEELAAQIEREAYELGYLANDYLLYSESQQAERWESKFASFSENLSNMQVNTPEQQALLSNIRTNQRRLRAVFTEIRTSIESAPQAQQTIFDANFMQVSWSRLEVQNQGLIFDASRLEGLLREQEDQLRRVTSLLSFLLIVMLGAFLLVSYGLIFRRTLQAITKLQAGTRIIGSGNLDYAIAVKNEDEIGELSHSFNQMTTNLKELTASKADLEREIFERVQAEQALRLSEKKFALAFANNPAAITLTRLDDGIFQDVNDTWLALTGYSRREVIGFSARKLPIWPTAKAAARFVQELQEKSALHWREQEFRKKSGEVFVAQLSAQLLPIQGELMILTTLVDITERKQAETALLEASLQKQVSEYTRTLIEVSLDPMVTISPEGKITDVNEATVKATGVPREELVGTNFSSYFTQPEKAEQGYRQVFAEGYATDYPLTIRHRDGRLMDVLYNASLYKDAHGSVLGVFAAARDVTAQKQAEAELKRHKDNLEMLVKERTADLEESSRELARSNENLQQFAYVASHDLQEPLRIMASYSQLLERRYKGKLDQDADEFIAFIVDAAARMQRLITDLLAYSRAGHETVTKVEVDCNELVRRLVVNMAATIESAEGCVTFDRLPSIIAHETSLVQLFQNLIGNALKFRGEQPPRIHVSARQADCEWLFSVRDNGIGIEPQYAQRIFMIFQRLHPRNKYPGTGIGLSICKKIVENLGGRIWMESEPGQGSTFYFTVPISKV